MVALSTAIIGASVIGAGAAVYSGSQAAKASKKASQVQQQAASEALQLQREQYDNAKQIFAKYGVQGDWARNQMAAFLGGPQSSSAPAPAPAPVAANTNTPATRPGRPGIMVRNREDIDGSALAGQPPAPMPTPAATGTDSLKTPDQLREEAWDTYEKSPFASIARTNADKATEAFTSMAGAQGSALSGRTVRGMAEVSNEMEQAGFGDYYGALSGFADIGMRADEATVGAGRNYADAGSNAITRSGDAAANGIIGQADAWNSALSDVAGWAGWAAGNMPGGTATPSTTKGVGTGFSTLASSAKSSVAKVRAGRIG